jgi:tetratricopeptide (TPR) repeat protein
MSAALSDPNIEKFTRDLRACLDASSPIAALIFAVVLSTAAYGDPSVATSANLNPPVSVEDLNARVAALKTEIYDPSITFSRSQKLAELQMLVEYAKVRGNTVDAVRDSFLMIGLIESKGGETKDVVAACREAFAIKDASPLPDERSARAHHMCADHLKDLEEYEEAATHYRLGIQSMKLAPVFTEDQRLGSGQDLGYVLHEAGKYQEALENNLEVLSGGERLHGRENPLLRSLVTNIAQNLHSLERKTDAGPYLLRALAMARADKKVWHEQDLLFQLGVLAHELGDNEAARRHMKERIDVIKKHKRHELLADATEDLKILEDRIAGRGP